MRRDWWMCAAVLVLAVFGVLLQVRLAGSVPELQGLSPLFTGLVAGVTAAVACGGGRVGRFLEGSSGGGIVEDCTCQGESTRRNW